MHTAQYQRIVRASALYDLIVTLPFVTPWSFQIIHQLLEQLAPTPAFSSTHVLFVNLFGSIVIVWSLLRLRHPEPLFGLYDSMGRGLFSFWFIYHLLTGNIHPVTWLFAAFEICWGVVQLYGYLRLYPHTDHMTHEHA